MKILCLLVVVILGFLFNVQAQDVDTIVAKVISVKILKSGYLIHIIPEEGGANEIIVASEISDSLKMKGNEIAKDKSYTWVIHAPIIIAYGPKNLAIEYGGEVVWTSKQTIKEQPRLCLNCNGKFIRPIGAK